MTNIRRGLLSTMATIFLLGAAAVGLSACNTTAGAGQDISAGGKAVTNSAETVKSKL